MNPNKSGNFELKVTEPAENKGARIAEVNFVSGSCFQDISVALAELNHQHNIYPFSSIRFRSLGNLLQTLNQTERKKALLQISNWGSEKKSASAVGKFTLSFTEDFPYQFEELQIYFDLDKFFTQKKKRFEDLVVPDQLPIVGKDKLPLADPISAKQRTALFDEQNIALQKEVLLLKKEQINDNQIAKHLTGKILEGYGKIKMYPVTAQRHFERFYETYLRNQPLSPVSNLSLQSTLATTLGVAEQTIVKPVNTEELLPKGNTSIHYDHEIWLPFKPGFPQETLYVDFVNNMNELAQTLTISSSYIDENNVFRINIFENTQLVPGVYLMTIYQLEPTKDINHRGKPKYRKERLQTFKTYIRRDITDIGVKITRNSINDLIVN